MCVDVLYPAILEKCYFTFLLFFRRNGSCRPGYNGAHGFDNIYPEMRVKYFVEFQYFSLMQFVQCYSESGSSVPCQFKK